MVFSLSKEIGWGSRGTNWGLDFDGTVYLSYSVSLFANVTSDFLGTRTYWDVPVSRKPFLLSFVNAGTSGNEKRNTRRPKYSLLGESSDYISDWHVYDVRSDDPIIGRPDCIVTSHAAIAIMYVFVWQVYPSKLSPSSRALSLWHSHYNKKRAISQVPSR